MSHPELFSDDDSEVAEILQRNRERREAGQELYAARDSLPTDPDRFFPWFKRVSEAYWRFVLLNPVYGFQIQQDTSWRPGLSDADIDTYESAMGFRFPPIYRSFLRHMNGTDRPAVNVYGYSGLPYAYQPAFFSYPDDLAQMEKTRTWIYESNRLTLEAVEQRQIPHIMPIIGHRCLVMDRCEHHPVLSIHGDDILFWASSLPLFLVEHLLDTVPEEKTSATPVPFWLPVA